jgi:hypothetical protein
MEEFETQYETSDKKPEEVERRLFQALKILLNEEDVYAEQEQNN